MQECKILVRFKPCKALQEIFYWELLDVFDEVWFP